MGYVHSISGPFLTEVFLILPALSLSLDYKTLRIKGNVIFSLYPLYPQLWKNIKGIGGKGESPSLNDLNNESSGKKGATASAPSIRCLWLHRSPKSLPLLLSVRPDLTKNIYPLPSTKEERKSWKAKKYSCLRHLNIVAVKKGKRGMPSLSLFWRTRREHCAAWIFLVGCFGFFFFFSPLTAPSTLHVCN